ncbi:dehydrin DHN2 [Aegilops tauschii subsp. strangulata]|uniref:dehydrin DHN2 n=1 Tax=Aegilops tauschii subsp. strangulata TaxID=200361 RepID=UPI00098B397A|nr:dehydrin DHN2 [Aegilops tauschii subsp. strangulata]
MDATDKATGHGGATGPTGNHGGAPAGGVQQLQATRDDRKTDGGLGRSSGPTGNHGGAPAGGAAAAGEKKGVVDNIKEKLPGAGGQQ